MKHIIEMPFFLEHHGTQAVLLDASTSSAYDPPHRLSHEKSSLNSIDTTGTFMNGNIVDGTASSKPIDNLMAQGKNSSLHSLPNGRSSGSTYSRDKAHSRTGSSFSISSGLGGAGETGRKSPGPTTGLSKHGAVDTAYAVVQPSRPKSRESSVVVNGERTAYSRPHAVSDPQTNHSIYAIPASAAGSSSVASTSAFELPNGVHASQPHSRLSTPPGIHTPTTAAASAHPPHPGIVRLQHRHTLQVPKLSTSRGSRDISLSNPSTSEDGGTTSGRFSPTTTGTRRASLNIARRTTRSIHSDMHLDEVPQDEEAARWTEAIRQKRASRRRRKEEEDDDRVVVGTKVDVNHVNWVTAYNMLTGIRFTVSRTNAKMNRELTDADFDAKHKFSFDITGNELTPSAKYDFKFKDYAPWVFRHLRAKFGLDPADYLISLTSKYILSELGSPGKSGSFFYFSRDYKYIIKTIHHAEHKLLRKILRDYYAHVEGNPNTLISQFYGLHRVKIPYGRKIHFVVMNNLFPPHRDIHQTFDLKGSTIGRDFKEEDLEKNPRATLKDLNWLRRDMHLEFGPRKKHLFIEQIKRDVALLQRLKIMDYSLLVGIHDLGKGNEENLRDKTLQIFEPGGERNDEPQADMLLRTPSKMENQRKARELRQIIKKEKPVPMEKSTSKMPDEMLDERKNHIFFSDDGGFGATHEDGSPGEEIYYLGIIDCLTHYGIVKKAEHLWKGMSHNKSQISPIPPEAYGDRFIKFITGITMSREEAEREKQSHERTTSSLDPQLRSGRGIAHSSTDKVMEKAEKQAHKTEVDGASENEVPDRTLSALRSSSADRSNGLAGATLPVVDEAGEAGSTGGRSGRSRDESALNEKQDGLRYGYPDGVGETREDYRPLTPPKDARFNQTQLPDHDHRPPTPPKDAQFKQLPVVPPTIGRLTDSPEPLRPIDP